MVLWLPAKCECCVERLERALQVPPEQRSHDVAAYVEAEELDETWQLLPLAVVVGGGGGGGRRRRRHHHDREDEVWPLYISSHLISISYCTPSDYPHAPLSPMTLCPLAPLCGTAGASSPAGRPARHGAGHGAARAPGCAPHRPHVLHLWLRRRAAGLSTQQAP